MPRAALSLLLLLAGAALVGLDARWIAPAGGELAFRWSWLGRVLWEGDRAELLARTGALAPPLSALALVLAGAVGVLAARAARGSGAPRAWVGLGAAVVVFAAVDPLVARFVAEREALSAPWYLDLGDMARALGWGAVLGGILVALPVRPGTPEPSRDRAHVALACVLALAVPAVTAELALGSEPLTNDGAAYRFQARRFAAGELALELGELAPFFPARQIVPGPRAFAKYPPGHSAALAVGELVGAPLLLPRLLAVASVLGVWRLARRAGVEAPGRAALLFALGPTFLGVESLWLSHATSLPALVGFGYAALRALDERRPVWALLAGAALSVALATRPLTAVAVALPFLALPGLWRSGRAAALIGATLAGTLPGAVAFLWINARLTGSPLETAYGLYAELVSPNDRWGLVDLPTALDSTAFNLTRLSTWLGGAALALLLPLAGLASPRRPRRALLFAAPLAALVAAYALHRFHGVPWAGPLYYVEALPFLALPAAQGLAELERRRGRAAARAALVVLALAAAQLLALHFGAAARERGLRDAPRAAARATGVERGVVFVPWDRPAQRKRYALVPPEPADELVFARDLGPRNERLLRARGGPPAYRFVPGEERLVPLP